MWDFGGFCFVEVSGAVWLVGTLVFVVCVVGFGGFVCLLRSVVIVGWLVVAVAVIGCC